MNNIFKYIPQIGTLRYDIVLFKSSYPILFTLLNEKNEAFLCVCCSNNNGRKWLITRTSKEILIDLLFDKITLREAFTSLKDIQISLTENSIEFSNEDWEENSIFLPKNEYLDVEDGEFDKELERIMKYYE